MKVLHLPYGAGANLSQALRSKGIDSTFCSFKSTNYYNYLADVQLNLDQYPVSEREKIVKEFFLKALEEYDIFHFHFGETFFPDKSDLKILSDKGKKLVVHHRGSEVRRLSIAKKFNNPYVRVKRNWTEEKILKNLKQLSKYIDCSIVNDHELLPYVETFYKKTYVVPQGINVNQIKPYYPTSQKKPLILHAPSNRSIKGTEFILDAIKRLKKDQINFKFKLIENMPHKKALQLYQNATIILDQFRIGSYANLSIESMAMGKPVMCYIREDLMERYPSSLPIVNANPDTIYDTLKDFLNHPENWEGIGKKGRQYVMQNHSLEVITQKLMEIYSEL